MNFLQVLRAVSIFQFLLVGLFLLFGNRKKRLSNIMLAGFLLSKVFCYLGGFLLHYQRFSEDIYLIFIVSAAFDLLLGPFLYFYIFSLTTKNFKLTLHHLPHTLLFILFLIYYLPLFLSNGIEGLRYYFGNNTARQIVQFVIYFQFIIYSALCLKHILQSRRLLKNNLSFIDETKLNWLIFLFSGFILIWLSGYINHISETFWGNIIIPWEFLVVLIFIFANIIVFMGLKNPQLLQDPVGSEPSSKYSRTQLSSEKKKEFEQKILSFMKNEKPYLNPEINLNDFSQKINIPSHYISQVLNSEMKQNFYDFINQWRVEESKMHLSNSPDRTILEVLFETGFNSKASFNRAFKKHTGTTPSNYKKTG